jgi:hypothetical protein
VKIGNMNLHLVTGRVKPSTPILRLIGSQVFVTFVAGLSPEDAS